MHLKWHLFLFSSKFSQQFICITCFSVLSWSLLFVPHPTVRMLSAVPNTFCSSLVISLFFHWNISPAGVIPYGSLLKLYLPKLTCKCGQVWRLFIKFQVVASLTCINYCHIACISYFGKYWEVSFNVDHLCTGLFSTWVCVVGSSYKNTGSLGESAFKSANSCEHVTIFVMHFRCCFWTH